VLDERPRREPCRKDVDLKALQGDQLMKNVVAAVAGLLSSACVVAGILLLVVPTSSRTSDPEIVAYFADGANRTSDIVGLALMFAGAALYLWFLGGLRSRLREGGQGAGDLAWLVGAAGSGAASLLIVAASLIGAVAVGTVSSGEFTVDPNLARLTVSTGATALFGSVVLGCVAVAATSAAIRRYATLPGWLGWLGLVVIPLAVVESVLLFPVFMVPLWVVATSLALGAEGVPGAQAASRRSEGGPADGRALEPAGHGTTPSPR
jgi:hypothetical protein